MELTKEECMKEIYNLERYIGREIECSQVLRELEKSLDILEQLINEHFDNPHKIDGNTSDGYHTFNELYHHRAILFSVICNQNKEIAWKSKQHNDGTMYDGMFIVGVDTPQGQYSYHYDIEPYWNMFDVKEFDKAPIWDGHKPSDVDRLLTINYNPPLKFEELHEGMWVWDNKYKVYNKVRETYTFNGTAEVVAFVYLNLITQWNCSVEFEENRFYRKEVL